MGVPPKAPAWTFRRSGKQAASPRIRPGSSNAHPDGQTVVGAVREADEMLGLQTTGPGFGHTDNRHGVGNPGATHRLGVLLATLPERVSRAVRQLAAGQGRSSSIKGGRHDRSV